MPNPFDRGLSEALAYDAWYETARGMAVFEGEASALARLFRDATRPWIELGTGTGRFSAAFAVDVGVDPAPSMLGLAADRLPAVVRGVAEALPFRSSSVGGVLSVTTIEFLASPGDAMREVARVLTDSGVFVLGFLPRGGPWAREYSAQGEDPRSPFHHARFFSLDEVQALAEAAGLRVDGIAGDGSERGSTEESHGFLAVRFVGEGAWEPPVLRGRRTDRVPPPHEMALVPRARTGGDW